MAATRALRSPLAVTLQVWRALLLREAVARISKDPMGWFWVIAEPVGHIGFLVLIYVIGLRQRHIVGADTSVFIIIGVLGFFLPRNVFNNGVAAVDASHALYAYRQVKPIDTVIARIGVQTVLWFVISVIVLSAAALLGAPIRISDPLGALAALACLWSAGVGLTLIFSVMASLSQQFGNALRLLMRPLYILSGVMFSMSAIPPRLRDVFLHNPFVHGLETLRVAFMPAYQIPPAISLVYLAQFAVVTIFLGLLLHVRFQALMRAK